MLAEAWLVAWFEYRRHLRSRFFWQWLLWLLPFNGLSHYTYPLWHYWLYAAYSLAIAGVIYAFGYRWARRRASEAGVS